MSFDQSILEIVVGLMVLANRLVEAVFTPIFDRHGLDKVWLMYIAWIVSGIFVWFSEVNLFTGIISSDVVGQIVTAIVAGGGANLLHDLTDKSSLALETNTEKTKNGLEE